MEGGKQTQDRGDVAEEAETLQQRDIGVIMTHDTVNSTEQLLGELPELPPANHDPSIYTRQTNPFKQERVVEIMRQITIGDDITEAERQELE